MRNTSVLLCLALVIFSCTSPEKKVPVSSAPTGSPVSKLPVFLEHYEHIFNLNMGATGCPGAAVTIVKDTSVVYTKGFGVKELGKKEPVTEHTLFRIGSISKGFASVLTAILVKRGILNWEDRIIDHVPYFALKDSAQTKRIRIKHILSHTTGLPSQSLSELIAEGMNLPDMIRKLKRVPLESVEGESFAYQNVAYSVIQEVIALKTGKPYAEWITEELFEKVGMKDASLSFEALMSNPDKSMPHVQKKDQTWEVTPIHDKYYNVAAAAGVNASISDMAQWLKVLMGGRPDIISAREMEFIHTPFIEHDSLNAFQNWAGITSTGYGMGFMIMKYQQHTLIWHSGTLNDFKSLIAFDPKEKIGICILFNGVIPYYRIALPEFFEMYYLYTDLLKN